MRIAFGSSERSRYADVLCVIIFQGARVSASEMSAAWELDMYNETGGEERG